MDFSNVSSISDMNLNNRISSENEKSFISLEVSSVQGALNIYLMAPKRGWVKLLNAEKVTDSTKIG